MCSTYIIYIIHIILYIGISLYIHTYIKYKYRYFVSWVILFLGYNYFFNLIISFFFVGKHEFSEVAYKYLGSYRIITRLLYSDMFDSILYVLCIILPIFTTPVTAPGFLPLKEPGWGRFFWGRTFLLDIYHKHQTYIQF